MPDKTTSFRFDLSFTKVYCICLICRIEPAVSLWDKLPVHLNLQTDYGVRVLMLLASSKRQMSVEEIARSYGISRNHLAKIAHRLQSLDYITTIRGRNGGITLAVDPKLLNVGTIVRKLESLDGFVECMAPATNTCPVAGICGFQGVLGMALHDFLARLDNYTIADLVPNPDRFVTRVMSSPPR